MIESLEDTVTNFISTIPDLSYSERNTRIEVMLNFIVYVHNKYNDDVDIADVYEILYGDEYESNKTR